MCAYFYQSTFILRKRCKLVSQWIYGIPAYQKLTVKARCVLNHVPECCWSHAETGSCSCDTSVLLVLPPTRLVSIPTIGPLARASHANAPIIYDTIASVNTMVQLWYTSNRDPLAAIPTIAGMIENVLPIE